MPHDLNDTLKRPEMTRTFYFGLIGVIIASFASRSNAQLAVDSARLSPFVKVVEGARRASIPLFVPEEQPGSFTFGSGAIMHSDGYVLTNNHVVTKNAGYAIYDGTAVRFAVVGRLPEKDLALVRLESRVGSCPAIPLGQSHDVMMGESVAVMGNPGGRGIVVTSGVVSATKMFIDAGNALVMTQFPGSRRDTFIQYDAASNRGNSGGPLLNMDGELIGIVAAAKPDEQNSGFAIPIGRVREMFDQLLDAECIHQREVGLTLNPRADVAIVTSVSNNSPAAEAGVQVGDRLTAIDGRPIRHAVDWIIALDRRLPKGSPLDVVINRGSTDLPVSIQPRATQPQESVSVKETEPGLKYEWFDGHFDLLPQFATLEPDRSGVTPTVDLESIRGDSKTDFAIRLSGYLKADEDGLYRVALRSDDGSRLTLGGTILVDHDGVHPPMVASRLVRLKAGLHPIQLEYFQGRGGCLLSMTIEKLKTPFDDSSDAAIEPTFFQ